MSNFILQSTEINKVHQVDKTKIPGEHTATSESQHFRYQKTGAGGTQTEDGRTDAPRTFTAGVDGKNAADAGSSKNSISKTGETVKGKMSAQDGRYQDLMGEKAAQYTKGILCAYRKIKKSLSKTRGISLSMHDHPNYAVHKNNALG